MRLSWEPLHRAQDKLSCALLHPYSQRCETVEQLCNLGVIARRLAIIATNPSSSVSQNLGVTKPARSYANRYRLGA